MKCNQPVDNPANQFVAIFAGCGGLSLGLSNAGWQGKFAVEKNSHAFGTLKHNLITSKSRVFTSWPDWLPILNHDITELNSDYEKQLRSMRGVKLVAGGPPCQGFSIAGKRKANDHRNLLIHEYINFVHLVRPNYLILENVRGIMSTLKQGARGRPHKSTTYKDLLCKNLRAAGFFIYPKILEAYDFGVPQRRPRFIMIGVCEDMFNASGIAPDSFDPFDNLKALREKFLDSKQLPEDGRVGPEEAISDLEKERNELVDSVDTIGFKQVKYQEPLTDYQKMMRKGMNSTEPNSMRLVNHQPNIQKRFKKIIQYTEQEGRKGVSLSPEERETLGVRKQSLVVLHPEKPTHTITTLPDDVLHYSEPRVLTVRENARLQSFPDSFEFTGTYTTGQHRRRVDCPRYTQVGNAVPPLLAEFLGLLVKNIDQKLSEPKP